MQLIVSTLLPYLTCITMVTLTAAIRWNNLCNTWSFVIFGALTLLGIHQISSVVLEAFNVFGASGRILEHQDQVTPESIERAQSALMATAIKTSFFVLFVGSLLLMWLKAPLSKE